MALSFLNQKQIDGLELAAMREGEGEREIGRGERERGGGPGKITWGTNLFVKQFFVPLQP